MLINKWTLFRFTKPTFSITGKALYGEADTFLNQNHAAVCTFKDSSYIYLLPKEE